MIEIGSASELNFASSLAMRAVSGGKEHEKFRIQRQTFGGTRSDAHLTADRVTLTVSGASDVGRAGEEAAIHTLLEILCSQGLNPMLSKGEDHRGEDAVITINDVPYTVQIITVPEDNRFWKDAASDSAATELTAQSAHQLIRKCIERKAKRTSLGERPRTIRASAH